MLNIIASINSFYAEVARGPSGTKSAKLLTTPLDNSAGTIRPYDNRAVYWRSKIALTAHNCIEFAKSRIKSRSPNYLTITLIDAAFKGDCYINFINGTAVVIHGQFVDKFYFKDTKYFSELYRCSDLPTILETFTFNNFIVVRSQRHQVTKEKPDDALLLIRVKPLCDRLDTEIYANTKQRDSFTVRYKVEQLAVFYCDRKKHNLTEYLSIAMTLDEISASHRQTLCHGDLWKANILRSNTGAVTLIDFDKALYFCHAYDFVYFHVMTRIIPRDKKLENLIDNIKSHSVTTSAFLNVECKGALGDFNEDEITLCIFLLAFLKLLERDLYNDRCGDSVSRFRLALNDWRSSR